MNEENKMPPNTSTTETVESIPEHENTPETKTTDTTLENREEIAVVSTTESPISPELSETQASQETTALTTSPSPSKKRLAVLLALLATTLLGAAAWYWFGIRQLHKNTISVSNTPSSQLKKEVPAATKTIPAVPLDAALESFIHPKTGETWYSEPKEIPSLDLYKEDVQDYFKNSSDYKDNWQEAWQTSRATYTEVGKRGDKTIILGKNLMVMGGRIELFEKSTDGKVVRIVNPVHRGKVATATTDYDKEAYSDKLQGFDFDTYYDSLTIPAEITLTNGEKVTLSDENVRLGEFLNTSNVTVKTEKTYGDSTLQLQSKVYDDTKLTNFGYVMTLPIGTSVFLSYAPQGRTLEGFIFDNGASTQVTYGGKTSYEDIYAIAHGCGAFQLSTTKTTGLTTADLTVIGKTAIGQTVYEPTSKTTGLYQKAYEEYAQMQGENAKSKEQYIKDHGLILFENANKDILVYVRAQYSAAGGCAKPVVYLYPTKTTQVSVKVGANVTVSDPLYPANGWQHVTAQPSGRLTYLGKTYDSLFWEGQGYGDYPGIVAGTVVKRADAASTIRRQLAEQGLNTKETADFMAFWESKIPNKPYIRLTWLNTAQMNTLAPLYISPKPDTVIRVFLDMDGFDTPPQLPVQKLTKIERRGFTVVEWGGLTSEIRH